MLLTVVTIALFLTAAALIGAGLPWKNRKGAKRCPRCRFDVSAASEMRCSECGFAWGVEKETTRRRFRKRRVAFGVVSLIAAGWLGWRIHGGARHWVAVTPRPVLAVILKMTVKPPSTESGVLPDPSQAGRASRHPWRRLTAAWEASLTIDRFAELAATADGTLSSLETLSRAAVEAEDVVVPYIIRQEEPAWPIREAVRRAHARRAELDTGQFPVARLPLGTFLATELPDVDDPAPFHIRMARAPVEIHAWLATSTDPAIRWRAFERLACIRDPRALEALRTLAEHADDARVRQEAREWADRDRSRPVIPF